jgi:hypothetical protein
VVDELSGPAARWRLRLVGALELLPRPMADRLTAAAARTVDRTGLELNIAVGYGGRQEIADAVRKLLLQHAETGTTIEELAEVLDVDHIAAHLYTSGQPDPTWSSGPRGSSGCPGFLMWQSAHSEFWFCEAYWPAFRRVDFLRALRDYAGPAPPVRLLSAPVAPPSVIRDYLLLALRLDRLRPGAVGMCTGVAALQAQVRAEPRASPSSLVRAAGRLTAELPAAGLAPGRERFLAAQLAALECTARRLAARPFRSCRRSRSSSTRAPRWATRTATGTPIVASPPCCPVPGRWPTGGPATARPTRCRRTGCCRRCGRCRACCASTFARSVCWRTGGGGVPPGRRAARGPPAPVPR